MDRSRRSDSRYATLFNLEVYDLFTDECSFDDCNSLAKKFSNFAAVEELHDS